MRRLVRFISLIPVTALALAPAARAGEFRPALSNGIVGEYLVTLETRPKDLRGLHFEGLAGDLAGGYGGSLGPVCSESVGIFAVHMTEEQARKLAEDPRVRYVEQNSRLVLPEPELLLGGEEACAEYSAGDLLGGAGGPPRPSTARSSTRAT